jgi:hypothetical protein
LAARETERIALEQAAAEAAAAAEAIAAAAAAADAEAARIREEEEIRRLEKEKEKEDAVGNIRTKMTGTIAELTLVERKKKTTSDKPSTDKKSGGSHPAETKPAAAPTRAAAPAGGGDWRAEIKKREREKLQEKMNAMKIGMPDYREPEKLQVIDWRDTLQAQAEENNPLNKWKKFDSGMMVKKVRPPPVQEKPKAQVKENPCTCNVGTCKQHSKFSLKLTPSSKKAVDEPLKRKASPRKNMQSQLSQEDAKPAGSNVADDQTQKEPKIAKLAENSKLDNQSVPRDRTRSISVARDPKAPVEKRETVTKIINFVAIKMTVEESGLVRRRLVKKKKAAKEVPPPPPEPQPPPSPPPVPPIVESPLETAVIKDPTPPPPPVIPTPPRDPTPPPVMELPPCPPPPPKPRTPSPPPPVRKFFPDPPPSEPYKPKFHEFKPTQVKLKYVPDEESPKLTRKRFSSDVEVKPFKLTAQRDNCVKKALFLGDQYVGHNEDNDEDSDMMFSVPYYERQTSSSNEKATTFIDQINSFASPYLQPRLWAAGSPTPADGGPGKKLQRSVSSLDDGLSWRQRFKRDLQAEQIKESSAPQRNQAARHKVTMAVNGDCKGAAPACNSEVQPVLIVEKPKLANKIKASTKIIDIITEKIREDRDAEAIRKKSSGESGAAYDAMMALNSPPPQQKPRRKISEYVFEKLRQERLSTSRSNTPLSPTK